MTKLPVWATVKEAFRALAEHRWALLRLGAMPCLGLVAVNYLVYMLWESVLWRTAWLQFIALDLAALVGELALVPFVVGAYRLLLLSPQPRDGFCRLGTETGPTAALIAGVHLSVALPLYSALPFLEHVELPGLWKFYLLFGLSSLYWAVLCCLWIRVAFLFPATCLGRAWSPKASWRETGGNLWRLLAAYAVLVVPLGLCVAAFEWILLLQEEPSELYLPPPPEQLLQWNGLSLPGLLDMASLAVSSMYYLVSFTLLAAVTSVAYATLTGYPAKGLRVPGQGIPVAPPEA